MPRFWELPADCDSLTDVDITRLEDICNSLKAYINNRGMGAHIFNLAPSTPIATGRVAAGAIGKDQVGRRVMTATQLASSAGVEATMDDEAMLHRCVDFTDAKMVRDGAPGYGIIRGSTGTMSIAAGSSSTTRTIPDPSQSQSPRKTILAPIRPVCAIGRFGTSAPTFPSAPISVYSSVPNAGGFTITVKAGGNLGSTFTFVVFWYAWTRLAP